MSTELSNLLGFEYAEFYSVSEHKDMKHLVNKFRQNLVYIYTDIVEPGMLEMNFYSYSELYP